MYLGSRRDHIRPVRCSTTVLQGNLLQTETFLATQLSNMRCTFLGYIVSVFDVEQGTLKIPSLEAHQGSLEFLLKATLSLLPNITLNMAIKCKWDRGLLFQLEFFVRAHSRGRLAGWGQLAFSDIPYAFWRTWSLHFMPITVMNQSLLGNIYTKECCHG